jgi:TonB family protein
LTQYLPNHDSSGHYVLPQLPSPFSEVIHGALVPDPTERISLDEIRAALDPAFVPKPKPAPVAKQEPIAAQAARFEPQPETVAVPEPPLAAAAQPAPLPTVDPLSVPLSPVSPNAAVAKAPSHIPVSSLPNVNVTIAAPRRVAGPRTSSGSLKYFIIGAAGTLVLAALIVPRLMRNSADSSAPSATAAKPGSTGSAAPVANTPATAEKTAPATSRTAPSVKPSVTTPAPAKSGASSEAKTSAPSNAPAAASRSAATSSSGTPAVVHQAIPGVSQKARSTIRGTVRINVRVQLNPDGSVSSAALDSPAGSQFFANLALKAARDWRFAPSAISSALLRFDFTNTDSTAYVVR